MSTSTPRIAFLGATGGCTLSALVHTLRASTPCIALVRTPSKLTGLLTSQGLEQSTTSNLLTIIPGNAHDVAAVKQVLAPNGVLVDLIVTGLGAAPSTRFTIKPPFIGFDLDDAHVCEKATRTLMSALEEIYASHTQSNTQQTKKPTVCFISTTGISRGPEDVPFMLRYLYHNLLHIPHLDKKAMEDLIRNNSTSKTPLFRSFVGIRPTLLTGSKDVKDGAGWKKVRAGTEGKPATGFTVKRADVGEWIFSNVVEQRGDRRWENEMVSLTS